MQPTAASKGLNLASLRRVRRLWQEHVQRPTLADLKGLGGAGDDPGCRLEAAQRTHWELKVRIAHRLRDFLFLPYEVMTHPSVRLLYEKYVGTYSMHEDFGHLHTPEAAAEYWRALAREFEEHQHVTRLLGHSRRQLVRLDPGLAPTLDRFLGRFFVSRIGTHLLGAHFLSLGPPPPGARKPAGVAMGVLQPTSPGAFVRDLSLSSASGRGVPVDVEDCLDTSILYIPGHLRGILRETLDNAVAATARVAARRGQDPEPVRVKVHRGQFGVFVTISDRGGGIACADRVWDWGAAPGAAPDAAADGEPEWSSGEAEGPDRPARLPLGFGLPLARLTARYFGGDIRLQTLVGHGTNAYVHIPELRRDEAVVADDAGMPP
mmetsp:Transcript_5553/g.11315  ORF Transcript_5553/g.11315 Transcript_5553/m.11315 type:complete len:377 (-) Transcript_5553:74-1204(-)